MTVEEIKKLAEQFSKTGKKWHFHILTPECQLNDTGKYTLVLENTSDNQEHSVLSDEPYMNIGQELVKLLHGDDVIKNEKETKPSEPSESVKKLLNRAKELMAKGQFWHHHMLFPGCKYNQHDNKWVIVFEEKEKGEIIESVTETEPKGDLQHIEALFYSQKK